MKAITAEFARTFASQWIAAWNAHDLERVLEHYSEDVEFYSPYIITLADEPTGRIAGKAALRNYWAQALAKIPELRFELIEALVGVNSLAIYYKGHRGTVAEVLVFGDSGRVKTATVCYSVAPVGN
jgi:ketosteroid isomerase-like protein